MSLITKETSRFVDKYHVTLDVCISSVLSQSKVLNPQQDTDTVDVCVEDETVSYLNRRDMQNALHARLVGVDSWLVCSNILDYELLDVETPTISLVGKITKAGIPVLVYSGDQDSVIPFTGSRTLVHGLMPVYEEVVLFFKVYWFRLNVLIAFGSLPRCCSLESI
ncbi:hypothetical protein Vadar_025773 [Vaccinium darrowii]|uniref:Uncharacterized protein n=1 Tax=Vaccinium darrowii TaxID=229202 RepID=A0ACB7YPH1_9ERIC|nr:hypothetical protein Vadar_025773 [Vaccinium darrowii]